MHPFFHPARAADSAAGGGHAERGGGHGSHGGRGGHGRHGGGDGGGGGGRAARLFGPGAIKLLTLHLLAEQPRHGYELARAIAGLVGGDYHPSPGVIYPTLALLADLGLASAGGQEGGRRQYAITPEGQAQLAAQQAELAALLARLAAARTEAGARGAPEIQRAMANLKMALQMRFSQGVPERALVQQVAALIDATAVGIERL